MKNIRMERFFSTDFRHPLECAAELGIQHNSFYQEISRMWGSVKMQVKAQTDMALIGYPVTEYTLPRVHRIYQQVRQTLRCEENYGLFVDYGYDLTAVTSGSEKDGHIIRLNSACVEELSDHELAALLGHEIGHIILGHIQNREILDSIDGVSKLLPAANEIVKNQLLSYYGKWMLASELSADRVSMIAANGIEPVLSLLKKQAGAAKLDETYLDMMDQKVMPIPHKMGMYYVLMSESLPYFGLIMRMQELKSWAFSDDLLQKAPYLHYLSRAQLQDAPLDKADEERMLLHRRANNGNAYAAKQLAQMYYQHDQYALPASPSTLVSLLETAAYKGDGACMYMLSQCMCLGMAGLKKQDERTQNQLIRAAGSRSLPSHMQIPKYIPYARIENLSRVIQMIHNGSATGLRCIVNKDNIGDPICSEIGEDIQDAFWIPRDELVYAAEAQWTDEGVFGAAITQQAIYGRILGEPWPVCIPWTEFMNNNVMQQEIGRQKQFVCNRVVFYSCPKELTGSLGEVFVRMKSLFQKGN